MSRGKKICAHLKGIRQKIADENGIPFEQKECTHTGDCRGTCPRCEAEVRYLEQSLTSKLRMGKAATVAGLSLSLAACGNGDSSLSTDSALNIVNENGLAIDSNSLADDSLEVEGFDDEPDGFEPILGQIIASEKESADNDDNPLYYDTATLDDDEIVEGMFDFVVYEKAPEFPGGEEALYKYLEENIHYPEQAKKDGISGTVVIKFWIEKDGSITHAWIISDIGGGCGDEALRAVKKMPKWKPAQQSGKSIRIELTLPIGFEIQSGK